jgi:PGF-CTERM protein
VFLVLVAVIGCTVPTAAQSPPPTAYYGNLTVNGDPAPEGLTITAEIDGEVRGSLTTSQTGAYGGSDAFDPKLQVDGESGDEGKTVAFYVDGVAADQTVTWQPAAVSRVDLTVSVDDRNGGNGGNSGTGGGGADNGGEAGSEQPPEEPEPPQSEPTDTGDVISSTVNLTVQASQVATVNLTDDTDQDGNGVADSNTNRTVTFDGLDIEASQDVDISLSISSSDQPPAADAPALTLQDGTEAVGYIRVDHAVPDEAIGNVTFRFRVSKAKLTERGGDASNVVLYRYHNNNWNQLATQQIGETSTHYLMTANSPGLSDFATGLRRPKFEIVEAQLTAPSLRVGDAIEVRTEIKNVGGVAGSYLAELRLNGETVDTREVSLPPGGVQTVMFQQTAAEAGQFSVTVNDVAVGELSVTDEPATETESETPGFGLGVALLALLSIGLFTHRR